MLNRLLSVSNHRIRMILAELLLVTSVNRSNLAYRPVDGTARAGSVR
jgi:hypothetical protein